MLTTEHEWATMTGVRLAESLAGPLVGRWGERSVNYWVGWWAVEWAVEWVERKVERMVDGLEICLVVLMAETRVDQLAGRWVEMWAVWWVDQSVVCLAGWRAGGWVGRWVAS